MLYDAVAVEVQRRKDLANAMITLMPSTNKCCQSTCCRCCLKNKKCQEFHQKMEGEDHYVLQTPLQWECRYQRETFRIRSPSIIADALISSNCALSYYLFVQKHITS